MNLTMKLLEEHDACSDGKKLFLRENWEGFDVYEVVRKLEEQKNTNDYIKYLFENFSLSGICRGWQEAGTLRYENNYIDGKRHGISKGWHDNGTLKRKHNYLKGALHGFSRDWYDNGQLSAEYNYRNFNRHGLCRNWYEDGTLWTECVYISGNINGVHRVWSRNGDLIFNS